MRGLTRLSSKGLAADKSRTSVSLVMGCEPINSNNSIVQHSKDCALVPTCSSGNAASLRIDKVSLRECISLSELSLHWLQQGNHVGLVTRYRVRLHDQ